MLLGDVVAVGRSITPLNFDCTAIFYKTINLKSFGPGAYRVADAHRAGIRVLFKKAALSRVL